MHDGRSMSLTCSQGWEVAQAPSPDPSAREAAELESPGWASGKPAPITRVYELSDKRTRRPDLAWKSPRRRRSGHPWDGCREASVWAGPACLRSESRSPSNLDHHRWGGLWLGQMIRRSPASARSGRVFSPPPAAGTIF